MESELLDFLDTKPDRNTVIFNVRDIIGCGHSRSDTVIGNRRSIGQQLYHKTKSEPLQIAGWDISLYHKKAHLAKYIATRR